MAHHRAPLREALSIPGPAGILEGLLEAPPDTEIRAAGVICHPHPQHQGTMQNKVVHTLCRSFNELQAAALRFNFRGVGGSEGHYGEGLGESADAIAACNWLKAHYPGAALWLAGFSFGAMVACHAALRVRPSRLITVAPPADRTRRLLAGQHPSVPWLLVQGDADGVVSPDDVIAWAGELSPRPTLVLLPGGDHFFHGNLTALRDTVVAWLRAA